MTPTKTDPYDYSAFSWESITAALKEIIEDAKRQTGASDEEINLAMGIVAERFMNVNCLALPNGPTEKK